ncbi:hypothetical protein P175DRAFT_0503102 [Aspergillus ochraceoroseus IBT 24754]|uniref:Uncharacterized protein n=1 Tax=Aspergillus ochraceoroseus IBT 24754 TaxID=1392256 RepID=A0A2T5LTF8_9EURO|nr:uncharacterized protein P175DRAFT_0503102 [Aspergillus ochraceoroseus IBT 24754]PTU19573.1 hypothetical protein P175DRAFT_0503102 [Aspergillus ochraceoroseus IBT 24754]
MDSTNVTWEIVAVRRQSDLRNNTADSHWSVWHCGFITIMAGGTSMSSIVSRNDAWGCICTITICCTYSDMMIHAVDLILVHMRIIKMNKCM